MRAFSFLFVLGVVALSSISCGGRAKSEPTALSQTWTAPSMLSKVPADSPYLVAILDPMPEAVRRQTFGELDKKVAEARDRLLDPDLDRSTLSEQDRVMLAVFDELKGRDLDHFGRELGFDPNGRFVLYGLSVWPVLRVEVADEKRLRQVIANVIRKAKLPAREHTFQGRTYWQFGDHEIAAVVSVGDREVVAAILPTPALAQYLPIVLGVQRPARSLNEDNKLSSLIAKYRFLPTMVGYIDTKIVADILGQRAASTNTELDRPLRTAMGPVDNTCKADLDRLAAFAPRMALGYRQLDAKGMQGSFVLEMPPSITTPLQRLRAAVPELERGLGRPAMMKLGIGAKLDELVPLLRDLTSHIQARPFQCKWFVELNNAASELATVLDQPLPPPLRGFRGMSMVIDEMTQEPPNARGHAVLVGDHAADLMKMLMALLPGIAGSSLAPDGRPVQLKLATIGAPSSLLGYAAASIDRATIAVGPKSAVEAVEALNVPAPAHSPLFSMTFDMDRMLELGLVKPEDASGLREVALQLEVTPDGLVLEMYATFPGR